MFKNGMKLFLGVPIIVLALLCVPHGVMAGDVNGTFIDDTGLGANPGNITLVHEHGGPTASNWTDNDTLLLGYAYATGNNAVFDLEVTIENTSDHMMFDTVLIFEQDAFNDWSSILADDSWDGTVGGNVAYYLGNIGAGVERDTYYISIQGAGGLGLAYDSPGLASPGFNPFSNVSIAHAVVVPEPISSTLFVVGGVALGFRRFRQQRRIS